MVPMITEEHCGFCGSDLRGKRIPVDYIVKGHYGDRDPDVPHFYSRMIGVEYTYDHPEHYDGISEFRCPDCGARVGRWSGKRLDDNEFEPRFGRVSPLSFGDLSSGVGAE